MKHDIGKRVKVYKAADDTLPEEYIGDIGIISAHNTNSATGNTDEDPLHVVIFSDGTTHSFWYEELIEI